MTTKVKEAQEKYKKTELGEIPVEWEIKTLGELGDIIIGLTYKPENLVDGEQGTLVLRSSNIKEDKLSFNDNKYVDMKIPEKLFVKENDILICSRNGSKDLIGKTAYIQMPERKMTFGAFMSIYRSPLNPYLYHCFKTNLFKKQINANLGATINQITTGNLKSFQFPIPPLKEQQKIAGILSTVDEQIENTKQLIKKTNDLKKGLIQRLLTKGIGHTKFKDTELGVIPAEWKIYQQGEIATFYNGRAYKQSEFKTKGTPIVRIQNLTGDREPVYSNLELEENKYIDNGDLIYAWSATFGPYIWKGPRSIYHYHIWKIEAHKNILHKLFFYYRLDYISNEMSSQKNGSAFSHITKYGMETHKIALPPIKEQQKIAEILSNVDEQIESYEQEKEKYMELKKGLMQQLLTGKIRVTV